MANIMDISVIFGKLYNFIFSNKAVITVDPSNVPSKAQTEERQVWKRRGGVINVRKTAMHYDRKTPLPSTSRKATYVTR